MKRKDIKDTVVWKHTTTYTDEGVVERIHSDKPQSTNITTGSSANEPVLNEGGTSRIGKPPVRKKHWGDIFNVPNETLLKYIIVFIIAIMALAICPTVIPDIIKTIVGT